MFSELQLKIAIESGIQGIQASLVKLQDFAHNYTEAEDAIGASIVVPTYDFSGAAAFNASTNNYAGGSNEVGGVVINLSSHYVKSVSMTDRDLAETGINWLKDSSIGIGRVLGASIQSGFFAAVKSGASATRTAEIDTTSAKTIAALYKACADNNMPVENCVVVLNQGVYSEILGNLPYGTYASDEAVKFGRVPGLFGFKAVICSTLLGVDADEEPIVGYIIAEGSVGLASRYLKPMDGAYPDTFKAVDPDSGLTIGYRSFCDLATGKRFLAGEVLMGFGVTNQKGIVTLELPEATT